MRIKLLKTELDNKLNFRPHISNICTSATNQLNASIRLQNILYFKETKILINSCVMTNFSYFALIWMFSIAISLKKNRIFNECWGFYRKVMIYHRKIYYWNLVFISEFRTSKNNLCWNFQASRKSSVWEKQIDERIDSEKNIN